MVKLGGGERMVRLDVDSEGHGTGTPGGTAEAAGLGLSGLGLLQLPEYRPDVDRMGFGRGTPRVSRSGAGLSVLPVAPAPQAVLPQTTRLVRLDVDKDGYGVGSAQPTATAARIGISGLGLRSPGPRLDVDKDGFGMGTVRLSRSGAGLVEGPWSGGRADVDANGFGVGSVRATASGAGIGISGVGRGLGAVVAASSSASQGGGVMERLAETETLRLRRGFGYQGDGSAARPTASGTGVVSRFVALPDPADAAQPGPVFLAPVVPVNFVVGGRRDVDEDGFGTGTPGGTAAEAGLGLSGLGNLRAVPAVRPDVDARGFGTGTPLGSRSGAGLLPSTARYRTDVDEEGLGTGTPPGSGQAGLALGAGVRLDVDAQGLGVGTPRSSRSGAGLVFLSLLPAGPRNV